MATPTEARRVGIWTIAVALIVMAIYGAIQLIPSVPVSNGGTVAPATSEDHTKGSGAISLIEYSDFQCPACKTYFPVVKKVSEELGDKVTVAYRHFPLVLAHQNARQAAEASEAAARQGKFWEMHDKLFAGQESWAEDRNAQLVFENYAREIGLNVDQFKTDLTSAEVRQRVERDVQSGNEVNIAGTPTFFLNGKQMESPRSYDDFRTAIDEAAGPTQ